MGRYEIARDDKNEEGPEKVQESIQTFGFEEIINENEARIKSAPVFRPDMDCRYRTGLVFKNPDRPFIGTKVHWHNKYFLCKSTKENKAICCTGGKNPTVRCACVIAVYANRHTMGNLPKSVDIMLHSFIFGKSGMAKLNEINNVSVLTQNDLIIVGTNNNYLRWEALPAKGSLWQTDESVKEDILSRAEFIFPSLPSYLGEDLTVQQIRQLYTEELRNRPSEGARQRIRPLQVRRNHRDTDTDALDGLLESM